MMNCYVKFVELITVLVVVRLIKMLRRGKKIRGLVFRSVSSTGGWNLGSNERLCSSRKFRGYCTWGRVKVPRTPFCGIPRRYTRRYEVENLGSRKKLQEVSRVFVAN